MEALGEIYGILNAYGAWGVVGSIALILAIGFLGSPFIVWTIGIAAIMIGYAAPESALIVAAVIAVIFNIKPIRAAIVSSLVMNTMKKLGLIPKISETERAALDAGKVWAEAELFSGKPNLKRLLNETYPSLNAEEQAFMDGPVEELCNLIDDWEITKKRAMPKEVWDFLRKEKFLGMIIPKEYGGLGISALGHGAVIEKISGRSITAGVTVMVPNSLGPAELLLHYGTQEQRDYYLPRLANGTEIPCFALTEPTAGSDAGSLTSHGELFKGEDGKLYIKLNWNKRYITLAAISTVLGLAFRLNDPNDLLGKGGGDLGITCALIPSDTPGVVIGRRHDPLNTPFYNCPTQGHDVVVSVDQIIGGLENAGKGWPMLMESLAAGRGISLVSQSSGGAKLAFRGVGAYSAIRKQFGMPVGKFEGVAEPLSFIGSAAYMLEALRKYTAGAIDNGIQPPVVTAIAKYNSTELMRKAVNHGMDIIGGAGISRGPRNFLANGYTAIPIGITVEGANILTRTLIIFGQGALRAHPYAYKEVAAVEAGDVSAFDRAFWGHINHIVRNACRALVLSATRGWLASSPVGGPTAKYWRKLSWTSATYAFMSDIAMGSLGGALKVKERLTGRYADILSWMYIGTAVLRRWEAEGRKKEDLPFVHMSMQYAFTQIQTAFDGIYENLPVPGLSWLFKYPIKFWSEFNKLSRNVEDSVSNEVARLMQQDSEQRDRLTENVFVKNDFNDGLAKVDMTFKKVKEAEAVEKKLRAAVKAKQIPRVKGLALVEEGKKAGVITDEEYALVQKAEEMRLDAVQVDDFGPEEYFPDGKKPIETEIANGSDNLGAQADKA
ncbi:MAG: acyl-CoA dehydrogenase [Bdellovibrionaceae bacterium]|nr:acyl-CoA dehydrogenase [Pseudobdellovibrionaceae bacterium]